MSRVCVVGLGYVGLPTAVILASRGHAVTGCDVAPHVVAAVASGAAHFREPDLDMLLGAALRSGRLAVQAAPAPADVFVIAVPTPITTARRADLAHVEAAVAAIAPVLRPGNTVILESTCPVGTTERIAARLAALRPDLVLPRHGGAAPKGCVHVAHCPERVLPGRMLQEIVANDRVIGGLTLACAARAAALYRSFATGALRLTDSRTAEFVKLAENAFRDVNIAFANEVALLCEGFGIDPWAAIALANQHPRVDILRPGPGVGGHCIAVDPWFLVEGAPDATPLIQAARGVNDAKPARLVAWLRAAALAAARPAVGCFGLAYKADVDDLRESPAVAIVAALAAPGDIEVLVCEPWIAALPPALAALPGLRLVDSPAALGPPVLAFLVAHAAFRAIPRAALAGRQVLDPVGLFAGAGTDRADGPPADDPGWL
jgi:UDP-N-acetyl-D-mannosaminuronic acid dehydrogenase